MTEEVLCVALCDFNSDGVRMYEGECRLLPVTVACHLAKVDHVRLVS